MPVETRLTRDISARATRLGARNLFRLNARRFKTRRLLETMAECSRSSGLKPARRGSAEFPLQRKTFRGRETACEAWRHRQMARSFRLQPAACSTWREYRDHVSSP